MNPSNPQDARPLAAPQVVQVVTRRQDGTRSTTIRVVGEADRVSIRSTNGRGAAWFRADTEHGTGQVIAGGTPDVAFTEVADADLPLTDAAYRAKYCSYASIADHLTSEASAAAGIEHDRLQGRVGERVSRLGGVRAEQQ